MKGKWKSAQFGSVHTKNTVRQENGNAVRVTFWLFVKIEQSGRN
jgi:hypothetical protein